MVRPKKRAMTIVMNNRYPQTAVSMIKVKK